MGAKFGRREAFHLLGPHGELSRIEAVAEVGSSIPNRDVWMVRAIDPDGAILETSFAGPSAPFILSHRCG